MATVDNNGDFSGKTDQSSRLGTSGVHWAGIFVKGVVLGYVAKTGAYTLTATDYAILADASGAPFTLTLPAAASHAGRVYIVKKTDSSANAVTIDGNAAETIDGAATRALTVQYESVTIICDGSNWHVI